MSSDAYWTNIRDSAISACNAGFPNSTYPVTAQLTPDQCYQYGNCVENTWYSANGGIAVPYTHCYYDSTSGYQVCGDNAQMTGIKQSCYQSALAYVSPITPPDDPQPPDDDPPSPPDPPKKPPEVPPCDFSECAPKSSSCQLL